MARRPAAVTGLVLLLGCAVLLAAPRTLADPIAYVVNLGTVGSQSWTGPLGMDFDVTASAGIHVTALGAFDSGQDGLASTITVGIFNRDTELLVTPSVTFTPADPGTLDGGSRFKFLTVSMDLLQGFHGSIIAAGYGLYGPEPNGNVNIPQQKTWWTDQSGAIAFVGHGRWTTGGFGYAPTPGSQWDKLPPDPFAAGTFKFSVIPEPFSMAFLASALVGVVAVRLRGRRKEANRK